MLAAAPEWVDAHLTAAELYGMIGDHDQARFHARRAATLDPYDERGPLMLARAIADSGADRLSRAEARDLLEAAVAWSPDDPWVYGHAAETALRLGDYPMARPWVEAGLALAPQDTRLLLAQARMSTLRHQRRTAFRVVRGLLDDRPGSSEALVLLEQLVWQALLRLAACVWVYSAVVTVVSAWAGPGVLRLVVLGCGVAIAFELESRLALMLPPRQRLRGGVGVARLVLFSTLLLGTCWSVVRLAAWPW
ncbi:tetratricopeptide repeat protein [Nocardia sp. NPDC050713]|uniref:tetratricopeptide repeat protein n=1 Tax=Nocardia sp. NPDC050713 TaxID=3154511 RepID=UPI0033F39922